MIYLGVDLSDEGTAVAVCFWNHSKLDVTELKLDGISYAIPSRMVRGASGEVTKIGRWADGSVSADERVESLRVNQRFPPSAMNDADLSAFTDSIVAFANALFKDSQSVRELWELDEKEYVFCFSCPTTWTQHDVDVYMEILKRLDVFVKTDEFFGRKGVKVSLLSCKRSHAAVLNLRRRIHGTQSSLASRGSKDLMDFIPDGSSLAIINLGDSTTEFSVAQNRCGLLNIISDCECGNIMLDTRFIDRAIYDAVLRRMSTADVANLMAFLHEHPGEQSRLVSFCRLAKEAYFDAPKEMRAAGAFLVQRPNGAAGCFPVDMVFPEHCEDIMQEALNAPVEEFEGRSWLEECRCLLERVKADCTRYGSDPKVIYLTGGASRMDFIYECATALFPDSRVVIDPHPSACIAVGLALMPHQLSEAQRFQQDVIRFVDCEIPIIFSEQSGIDNADGKSGNNDLMAKLNGRFVDICRMHDIKPPQLFCRHDEQTDVDRITWLSGKDKVRQDVADTIRFVRSLERWCEQDLHDLALHICD